MKFQKFFIFFIFALGTQFYAEVSRATALASINHWNGELYQAHSNPQQKWAKDFIKKIPFRGTEKVLDIGSGDGKITIYLAEKLKKGGSVLGVDPSDSMLTQARKIEKRRLSKNLSFLKGNVLNLEFENEFDLITGFSFFHWVEDQALALKKMQKSLRSGGKIYLLFNPEHGRKVDIDDSISAIMKKPKWSTYLSDKKSGFTISSPKKLIEMIEDAGLLLDRMEVIPVHDRFENRSLFVQFIESWMYSLTYIPVSLKTIFVNEIVDDYLKKDPLEMDGSLIYHDYMMELVLYKEVSE